MPDFAITGISRELDREPRHASPPPLPGAARWAGTDYFSHYVKRPLERILPFIYGAIVLAALGLGFMARGDEHIIPKEGLGYWLGITGALLMLSLLLYPLRKRIKALRRAGSVKSWFRAHMMVGILGPTLILFHSNFHLQSSNATVATAVMLVVVASGLVGRYLYARIHLGLYGKRAEAQELLGDIAALKGILGGEMHGDPAFVTDLGRLETLLPDPEARSGTGFWTLMSIGMRTRVASNRLRRRADVVLKYLARNQNWPRAEARRRRALVSELLSQYQGAVVKTARLGYFARLFALWHVLHLPLFFLLIVSAIAHVIAVHLY